MIMPSQTAPRLVVVLAALLTPQPALSFVGAIGRSVPAPTRNSKANTGSLSMAGLDEYRGSKKWEGITPATEEPRVWDEGFRSFLIKYGMINHVVYDVFIKNEEDYKNAQGLRGCSRFNEDLKSFTEKGLEFSYVKRGGEKKQEYDFTKDYKVISNIVCSPRSFFSAEDNWFGFVLLSNDSKEMIVVFRGTETCKEWTENATMTMTQLEGTEPVHGLGLIFHSKLMCHLGFQQLYLQQSVQGLESPKQTVHRMVWENKATLEKVTIVGHSLGAAMAQLCAVDLTHSKVLGDIPILAIAFAPPKIGNKGLAQWVDKQENLRILRVRNPIDDVTNLPPNWLWAVLTGGYTPIGVECNLANTHLHEQGIVKGDSGNSPNHNLAMYLHNIDPTRDIALMNKVGDVIPDVYAAKNGISPMWHSQTWPRTTYDNKVQST